ncbi:MAG TPA: hypothetical protein DCG49_04405 [Ruminococcus sp.]|nr:hypothetical protein [Ruminococcus sp.]
MGFLSKRNFKHNQEIPLPAALINGQSLGAVSGMKFGLSTMSLSGCEVIAVYNALVLTGKPKPFIEIARYMERFRVLFGFWGSNLFMLGHCLKHFGMPAKRIWKPAELDAILHSGKTCLYVYWVGRIFRSSVHTVVLQDDGGMLLVYNAFNKHGKVVRAKYEDYLKKRRMIFGYVLEEET